MNTFHSLVHRFQRATDLPVASPVSPTVCPACAASLIGQEPYGQLGVCERCRHHFPLPALQRVASLADAGSFREYQRNLIAIDALAFRDRLPYMHRLEEARQRTGLRDAAVFGTCTLAGHPVVLVVIDFAFMGGSMGTVVGEKVTQAFELARKRRIPIITVTSSGGARMQEGMLSLVQMVKTGAAAQRLHQAGVPFISVLAHPTTGGVYASFASLADVAIAEPHALIGFAGPRVVEQMARRSASVDAQSAEAQYRAGMLDIIVDRSELRDNVARLLDAHSSAGCVPDRQQPPAPVVAQTPELTPWEHLGLARHPDRPTALVYIEQMTTDWIELHGDRVEQDDQAIVCGLAKLEGQTIMIIGHERGRDALERERHNGGSPGPAGFRKAQRAMALAAKWQLPLICLIDTPGADPSVESEQRGLARTIAVTLAHMSELPVPTLSVVIGEGGSGGAIALGVADRILMLEHAVYSVIPPEGAAAILYHDAAQAEQISGMLKLTARDCAALGVVDGVVAEPAGGAHTMPQQAAASLKEALLHELASIQRRSGRRLVADRYRKFRAMGRVDRARTWERLRLHLHLALAR